jgi:hypothetical protein
MKSKTCRLSVVFLLIAIVAVAIYSWREANYWKELRRGHLNTVAANFIRFEKKLRTEQKVDVRTLDSQFLASAWKRDIGHVMGVSTILFDGAGGLAVLSDRYDLVVHIASDSNGTLRCRAIPAVSFESMCSRLALNAEGDTRKVPGSN